MRSFRVLPNACTSSKSCGACGSGLVRVSLVRRVRFFGRDIFERFAGVGLSPCIATHAELLADYDPDLHEVNLREPFFLFVRKA